MPTTPKNCLHWLSKHSQQREHFYAKHQVAHNADTSAERFPGVCIASLHCVRKCSSSLTDESCRPCCVSCTSRSRKLVYPNSTSSRQSEKSSSRLCREFWAMSLSSSSMWTVSLQNAKTKTISDDYSFLLHGALFSQRVGGEPHLAKRSMSSILDRPSGRIRGMAATHVRNKSIFGFLSPLTEREGMSYAKVNNERDKTKQEKKRILNCLNRVCGLDVTHTVCCLVVSFRHSCYTQR